MDVSGLLQKEPQGCMQRTSGNTWKVTQVLTLVMLPCPSLPFQDLPKEPSYEAAEGMSAAPGSTRTESVVPPWCPVHLPLKVGQDTANPACLCLILALPSIEQGLK